MKKIVLFLLLLFFSISIIAQKTIASSDVFRLEKVNYNEKKPYKYALVKRKTGPEDIIKTFDDSYEFEETSSSHTIICIKYFNGMRMANLFDIKKADFISDWKFHDLKSLNDSIYIAQKPKEKLESAHEWVVIKSDGRELIQRQFNCYIQPTIDTSLNRICIKESSDSILFYDLKGQETNRFVGYNNVEVVNKHFLVQDKSRFYGLFNSKGTLILPFQYLQIEFNGDTTYCLRQDSTFYLCEVFKNPSGEKLIKSFKAKYIEFLFYTDKKAGKERMCIMVERNSTAEYYGESLDLVMEMPVGKGSTDESLHWRIIDAYDGMYIVRYAFGELINRHDKIVIADTKITFNLTGFLAFAEHPAEIPVDENDPIFVLNEVSDKNPIKAVLQTSGSEVKFEKLISSTPNLHLYKVYTDNGIFYAMVEGTEVRLVKSNMEMKVVMKNSVSKSYDGQEVFSYSDGKLSGVVIYDFYSTTKDNLVARMETFFDVIKEVHEAPTGYYVLAELAGKQCLAYFDNKQFNYLEVDVMPNLSQLGDASNENPFFVMCNKKKVKVNSKLKTLN